MIVSQSKICFLGSLGSGMASPFTQMTHVQSPLQVLTAEPGGAAQWLGRDIANSDWGQGQNV